MRFYVRQIQGLLPESVFDDLAFISHISSRTARMDERSSLSGVSSAILSACKVGGWSKLSRISRDLLGNRGNRPSSFSQSTITTRASSDWVAPHRKHLAVLMPGTTMTETRKIILGGSARYASKPPPFRIQMTWHTSTLFCVFVLWQAPSTSPAHYATLKRFKTCPLWSPPVDLCKAPTVWSICSVPIFTDPTLPRLQACARPMWPYLQCILLKHIHFHLL